MTYKITLQDVVPLTHDTRHYVFDKPDGYRFSPGQATDLALDADGWRDATRPFTFTTVPQASVLGFTIKSYMDRDGVTRRIGGLKPGDSVLVGEPWGAIGDKGPGTFIAAGAGITPFIPILQDRARRGALAGCRLIFANRTPSDSILRPLGVQMKELDTTFVGAEEVHGTANENNAPGKTGPVNAKFRKGMIDDSVLDDAVSNWDLRFYVCGPPEMEQDVIGRLKRRGVSTDQIVQEQ